MFLVDFNILREKVDYEKIGNLLKRKFVHFHKFLMIH